jgi:hypothetical protein
MARLRVFVSSTYYDLKHVRSSMENFVESLGYEAVLSEKGNIAFRPDVPLDESCYREAQTSDMLVLIIGGRYGSEASGEGKKTPRTFFERYDSITRLEYRSAVQRDIPLYILIDGGVYAEYQTFLRNRDNTDVKYAHVDSVNVFSMIEEILSQPRNNPVKEFDRYHEIEQWLREQWAGLFKELLSEASHRKQITGLATEVAHLGELNATMKRYLEEVINSVAPGKRSVIQAEERRLNQAQRVREFDSNPFVQWLLMRGLQPAKAREILSTARGFEQLPALLQKEADSDFRFSPSMRETIERNPTAQQDVNKARAALGLPPLALTAEPAPHGGAHGRPVSHTRRKPAVPDEAPPQVHKTKAAKRKAR